MGRLNIKKKIFGDMLLNIIATVIPVAVLQLWILPQMAARMSDNNYGLLVTVVALFNVVPSMLGNTLNNIRLLHPEVDDGRKKQGDFNFLLIILSLINFIVICIFSVYYDGGLNILSLLLNVVVSFLWLIREYFIVAFRIIINYKAILINNIIMIAGYAAGYFLFCGTGLWQFVYLLGHVASLIYIFIKCNLWKEKPERTEQFKGITIETGLLTLSNLFGRVVTYADKLLLYPLLGGTLVAIYYASTIFGKIVSMGISPVSSVILSYLSKSNKKNDKTFKAAFLVSLVVCIIGFFICILISRPVLNWLYPQYVNEAMKYIWITTASTAVTALISIVNPFVLKFFPMKWQVWTNFANALLYVVICLLFLQWWGLTGFCLGALITSVIKLLFLLFIYYKTKEKNN